MSTFLDSISISERISLPVKSVYDFVLDAENLPLWAEGLCTSVTRSGTNWIVHTGKGDFGLRFCEPNTLGVLDHYVTLPNAQEVYVPLRVIKDGAGSEIFFTVFREQGMEEERFRQDQEMVKKDLRQLKKILEVK